MASLNEKLEKVKWGEFTFSTIFNKIVQGRRLKKDDQLPGTIPFIMAGVTNTGIVNYISNPVAIFPSNSITVDIFGNTFYRDFQFGAGDDTGVYWSDQVDYSPRTMLFFSIAVEKALKGKFDFGNKLRSSKSFDFKMYLPIKKNGAIDFAFIDNFIAELEAERLAELEAERLAELEAYLKATGLENYELTDEEQIVIDNYKNVKFEEFYLVDIFNVKNTSNLLSRDITPNSGTIPYLCASSENNAVSTYISHDEKFLDKGNSVFIGGKTFVVTYQENDFFSNDSHNLVLYLKEEEERTKFNQLFLSTCVYKSLSHKYSWGDSISNKKIQKDKLTLPIRNNLPDFSMMGTLISAIQKLVIKDVVQFADKKIALTKEVINESKHKNK